MYLIKYNTVTVMRCSANIVHYKKENMNRIHLSKYCNKKFATFRKPFNIDQKYQLPIFPKIIPFSVEATLIFACVMK